VPALRASIAAAAAAALLFASSSACRRPAAPESAPAPRATYRLDFAFPDAIDVTLRVEGVSSGALVSPRPVEVLRMSGFRVVAADGLSPVRVTRSAETAFARDDADGREVSRTIETWRVEGAPRGAWTVTYRVRPGVSDDGVLAGSIGPEGALFSGDQVFYSLLANGGDPPSIRLEIGPLPAGFAAEGLPVGPDGLVVGAGIDPLRALLSSPIRVGPGSPTDAAAPEDLLRALGGDGIVPPEWGPPRVLTLAAPAGSRRIDVSAGPLAIALESGRDTPRRRERIARLLVERWFTAARIDLRKEDRWLEEALPAYLAASAGGRLDENRERLYREHAATFPGGGTSLADSFRPGAPGARRVRTRKGPLVLGILDEALFEAGAEGGAEGLLRRFLGGPEDARRKGFSAAVVEALTRERAVPLLDRLLGRAGLLLGRESERLPDLAPVSAAAGGPVARELTILVTGAGRGYLESCGCRKVPAGGAARRAGVVARVKAEARETIVLDAGDFLPYADPLTADEIRRREEETIVETMNAIGVAAAALSANEALAGPERISALARLARFPLLSANFNRSPRLAEGRAPVADGVAVFGASGVAPLRAHHDYVAEALERASASIVDPVEPLADLLRADASPVRVVIGCLAPERIRALVAAAPGVDVVVSTDDLLLRGPEDAPRGRDRSGYLGTTLVHYATAGDLGIDRLDLRFDSEGRLLSHEAAFIELVPGTPEDAAVSRIVESFREFASSRLLERGSAPDRLPGDAALLDLEGNGFAGNARCVECHADAHAPWAASKHSGATETLRRVRRDLDPRCLSCHVTHLRYEEGKPAFLDGVGCEACHGPGALHGREPERKGLLVAPVAPGRCRACHTPERNPSFEGRAPEMLEAIRHWK